MILNQSDIPAVVQLPAIYIIETKAGIWTTFKHEVAAKYQGRDNTIVTPYMAVLPINGGVACEP